MKTPNHFFFTTYKEIKIRRSDLSLFTKKEISKIDLDKIIRVQDNSTIVTIENWNDCKEVFKKQRFKRYNKSLTIDEIVNLEIENIKILESVPNPSFDFKILAKRYIELLQQTETRLSLPKIALIHAYRNDFKSENAQTIAESYKWTSKGSGKKLIEHYNKVHTSKTRMADEGTKPRNTNKKNRIESILEYLTKEQKNKALEEIKSLEKTIETYL